MSRASPHPLPVEPFVYTSAATRFGTGYHLLVRGATLLREEKDEQVLLRVMMRLAGLPSLPRPIEVYFLAGNCGVLARAMPMEKDWMGRPGTYCTALAFALDQLDRAPSGSVLASDPAAWPFVSHEQAVQWEKAEGSGSGHVVELAAREHPPIEMHDHVLEEGDVEWFRQRQDFMGAAFEARTGGLALHAEWNEDAYRLLRWLAVLTPRPQRAFRTFAVSAPSGLDLPVETALWTRLDPQQIDTARRSVLLSADSAPQGERGRGMCRTIAGALDAPDADVEGMVLRFGELSADRQLSAGAFWDLFLDYGRYAHVLNQDDPRRVPAGELAQALRWQWMLNQQTCERTIEKCFVGWMSDSAWLNQLLAEAGALDPALQATVVSAGARALRDQLPPDVTIGKLVTHFREHPALLDVARAVIEERMVRGHYHAAAADFGAVIGLRDPSHRQRWIRMLLHHAPEQALEAEAFRTGLGAVADALDQGDLRRLYEIALSSSRADQRGWAVKEPALLRQATPDDAARGMLPAHGDEVGAFIVRVRPSVGDAFRWWAQWPASDEAGRRAWRDHLLQRQEPLTRRQLAELTRGERLSSGADRRRLLAAIARAAENDTASDAQAWLDLLSDTVQVSPALGDLLHVVEDATREMGRGATARSGLQRWCRQEREARLPRVANHGSSALGQWLRTRGVALLALLLVACGVYWYGSGKWWGPRFGVLAVVTAPPSATVRINGLSAALISPFVTNLPIGDYRMTVDMNGYDPREEAFTIHRHQTNRQDLKLQRAHGWASIRSVPEGALISIAGESCGLTPKLLDLAAGENEIVLRLADYLVETQRVTVSSRNTKDDPVRVPEVRLVRDEGSLVVDVVLAQEDKSEKRGKIAFGTGNHWEDVIFPVTRIRPSGSHWFAVQVEGYEIAQSELRLQPQQSTNVTLALKPRPAQILVGCVVADAQVYLDGSYIGKVGVPLTVPALRPLTLEVRAAGFETKTIDLDALKPGQPYKEIRVVLTTIPKPEALPELKVPPLEPAQSPAPSVQTPAGVETPLPTQDPDAPSVDAVSEKPSTGTCVVAVSCDPADATVILQKREQSMRTFGIPVFKDVAQGQNWPHDFVIRDPGTYRLVAEREGFIGKTSPVVSRMGERVEVAFVLQPKPVDAENSGESGDVPAAPPRLATRGAADPYPPRVLLPVSRVELLLIPPPGAADAGVPLYVGKYEVTRVQWKAIMGELKVNTPGLPDEAPANYVPWQRANEFCMELCRREGLPAGSVRLPTRQEWDRACRAGTRAKYAWGDNPEPAKDLGWLDGEGGSMPKVVGQKKPNAWGLYDMYGNVWEWISETVGKRAVALGGGYGTAARQLLETSQVKGEPLENFGFRVVADPQIVQYLPKQGAGH